MKEQLSGNQDAAGRSHLTTTSNVQSQSSLHSNRTDPTGFHNNNNNNTLKGVLLAADQNSSLRQQTKQTSSPRLNRTGNKSSHRSSPVSLVTGSSASALPAHLVSTGTPSSSSRTSSPLTPGSRNSPHPPAPRSQTSSPASGFSNLYSSDNDDHESDADWDVGVGNLVIDLDADIERNNKGNTPTVR